MSSGTFPIKVSYHQINGRAVKEFRLKSSSTVEEVEDMFAKSIQIEDRAAFQLWALAPRLTFPIPALTNIFQLIRSWPQIVARYTDDTNEKPPLMISYQLKAALNKKEERTIKDPVALELIFGQAFRHFLSGVYPCEDLETAIQMAGLKMQCRFGDYNSAINKPGALLNVIHTLIPQEFLKAKKPQEFEKLIYNEHGDNVGKKRNVAMLIFLSAMRRIPHYGSSFFTMEREVAVKKRFKTKSEKRLVSVAVSSSGFAWLQVGKSEVVEKLGHVDFDSIGNLSLGTDKLSFSIGDQEEVFFGKVTPLIDRVVRELMHEISASLASIQSDIQKELEQMAQPEIDLSCEIDMDALNDPMQGMEIPDFDVDDIDLNDLSLDD